MAKDSPANHPVIQWVGFSFAYIFVFILYLIVIVMGKGTDEELRGGMIDKERAVIQSYMGETSFELMEKTVRDSFRSNIVRTGVMHVTYELFTLTPQQLAEEKINQNGLVGRIFSKTEEVIDSFWYGVFLAFERFYVYVTLLPLILIAVAVSGFDGAMRRKIKIETNEYASPNRLRLSVVVVTTIIFGFPFILTAPMFFTVGMYYLTVAILSMCAWLFAANFIKKF